MSPREPEEEAPNGAPRCGPGAVILGGAHGSLAVARSLGRRGIPVWFVTDDHPLARFSRYTARSVRWAGPNDQDAVGWLLDLARRHALDGWVLFAGGDAEVRFVAQHHAALGARFRLTTPPWPVARWACDKRLTHRHAAAVGIDSPWSVYPGNRERVAVLECPFPVILKPTVREQRNAFTIAKAWRANGRAELLARYDQAAALVGADTIAIQELIPGAGEAQFSYAAVWKDGAPIASLVARRTRQYPVDFGFTSTFVETVEQSEVEAAACRFLAALEFSGMVEVEFKRDGRDGRYKLLDVNPRPWTWTGLGVAAGVDFAYVQWLLATGHDVARHRGRPGVAWMHAARDFAAACQLMAAGVLSPGAYLKSWLRRPVFAAMAANDPWPGIVELPIVMGRLLARRVAARSGLQRRPRPSLSQ